MYTAKQIAKHIQDALIKEEIAWNTAPLPIWSNIGFLLTTEYDTQFRITVTPVRRDER